MWRFAPLTCVVSLAMCVAVPTYAQVAREGTRDDSVAALLMELERQWAETPSSQKIPVLERIFADDFLGTDPAGRRYTKAQRIEHLREHTVDGPPNHLDEVRVRFFGENMAVLYGTESSTRRTSDGRDERRVLVWTDTWLRRNGRWQIVAAHDLVPAKAQIP
jgi:hypothetical protein